MNALITQKRPNQEERQRLKLDTIKLTGEVEILQGEKVVARLRNHFVNQGLISLINLLACNELYSTSNVPARNWATKGSFIALGTDTATTTGATMAALVSPIGAAPGTKADSQGISSSSPATGQYEVTYTATWNAGTISGTIGELGLYLYGKDSLSGAGGQYRDLTYIMFSRLSVADTDFTAYTIDTALPLTVQWRVRFSFA